jgi:hypothetical protein
MSKLITRIAMLNSMGDLDFEKSLKQQSAWGITDLDLKDSIFGKSIIELNEEQTNRAAQLINKYNMKVYCLSTTLFHDDLNKGETQFAVDNLNKISQTLSIARILKPRFIRLLPAKLANRKEVSDSIVHVKKAFPWLFNQYRQAIAMIKDAGFEVTIENEVFGCIFGSVREILGFSDELGDEYGASFTWDIQNLWQSGTFPSLNIYHQLKPLINYVHVKGGIKSQSSNELEWASALEDASWPVKEIIAEVIRDGLSPVICINPSHGKRRENIDYQNVTAKDVAFLKSIINQENA